MKHYLSLIFITIFSIISAQNITNEWLINELSSYDIFYNINNSELKLVSDFIIDRAEQNSELKNILEELYSESQTDFTNFDDLITRTRNSKKIIRLLCCIKKELEECCANLTAQNANLINQIEIIISSLIFQVDLGPVFTTLTDIKSTITECCANLHDLISSLSNRLTFTVHVVVGCDFTTVFTALADIKLTITECCAVTQNNFNNTFTVLRDIKNTITECCAQTQINFNNTFTVLADLKSSITTLISVDFAGVFTTLNDIKNTLTICCATNQTNFSNTFTVLADIKNTLTICCATNQTNFNNTFTVLADIKDTITECCADLIFTITSLRPIAIVDFSTVFTALADIKLTLTQCCAQNQTNFNNTWTILADIKRTLTACCAANQTNFNNTFTAIADLKNTLTILITNGFNGTFTVLADIKKTLTECCATTQNNFNGTFTVLAEILNTVTTNCIPITIGQNGQPVTISSSGSYCLTNNITAPATNAITIQASDVTLDLNGWTLQAPTDLTAAVAVDASGATRDNIVIRNGNITNSSNSILLTANGGNQLNNVLVENILVANNGGPVGPITCFALLGTARLTNVTIRNCQIEFVTLNGGHAGTPASGIFLQDSTGIINNISIEDCFITNCTNAGISFINNASANDSNISIKNCLINNNGTNGGIDFASALVTPINVMSIIDCQTLSNTGTGISVNVNGCTIQNTISNSNSADGINVTSSNFAISNCVANANSLFGINASSLGSGSSNGTIKDCIVHQSGFAGISLNGSAIQVENCNIVGTGVTTLNRDGIRATGPNHKILNSIINNNRIGINADFTLSATNLTIVDCDVSSNKAGGIVIFANGGTIANCTASNNSGAGANQNGIQVRGNSVVIVNNRVQLNGLNGILLSATTPRATNCEVRNNTAVSNANIGILDGAGLASANKAYLNYATNNTAANFSLNGVDTVRTIHPTAQEAFMTSDTLDARNWVLNIAN
ncbi:right-handed parallel beta-helix repeat-containing protein [Candidatus Dependentiae bacterium]|nr:right-handed parallel beta-helix repeat-containing protein [Candidatus Dependentiae bacterium]